MALSGHVVAAMALLKRLMMIWKIGRCFYNGNTGTLWCHGEKLVDVCGKHSVQVSEREPEERQRR